jgi:predicted nucleic acid-binding protein
MNGYVIDASVAAKWFSDEEHSERALGLLKNKIKLMAPDFFLLEMDSLACKWVRRGVITLKEAKEVRKVLRLQKIDYHPTIELLEIAFEIASQTGSSFYDCLYLALALVIKAKMVTADQRFFSAISSSPLAGYVEWIGNTT